MAALKKDIDAVTLIYDPNGATTGRAVEINRTVAAGVESAVSRLRASRTLILASSTKTARSSAGMRSQMLRHRGTSLMHLRAPSLLRKLALKRVKQSLSMRYGRISGTPMRMALI